MVGRKAGCKASGPFHKTKDGNWQPFPRSHPYPRRKDSINIRLFSPHFSSCEDHQPSSYAGRKESMKNTGKGPKAHTKGDRDVRKDRKSSTGLSGAPKKGGHGGKFTWAGDDRVSMAGFQNGALDAKDPNFEDPEEDVVV
ncbi:hypothetical protein ACLOJK_005598 [Asimina triloba]